MKDDTKWGAAIATLELNAKGIENDATMQLRAKQLRAAAEFLKGDNDTIHIGIEQRQTETEKVRDEWCAEYVALRDFAAKQARQMVDFIKGARDGSVTAGPGIAPPPTNDFVAEGCEQFRAS